MESGERKWRICCVSDTHGKMALLDIFNSEGDLFIHAGDFTQYSRKGELEEFCELLDRLKYRHKVVVCGNHELTFDGRVKVAKHHEKNGGPPEVHYGNMQYNPSESREMLSKHCTYLQHESVTLEGVKIFGSPFTIKHSDTAFQYEPKEGEKLWKDIPVDTDILVTHQPPYQTMDSRKRLVIFTENIGCRHLAQKMKTIHPKLHVFGHVHDSTGMMVSRVDNHETISINAAQQLGKGKGLKNRPFFLQLSL